MFDKLSGLVTNSDCGDYTKQEGIIITTFVANDEGQTSNVSKETLDGKEYLVIPTVAVQEQVLNGELAPAEEIGAYPDMWNGIPVSINHPKDENGNDVSANHPEVYEKDVIGKFFNAEFDKDTLKGEIWIDIEKAKSLGGEAEEVLNRAENGEPIEVSTAYFRDVEQESGTFNGEQYNGIQRNMRPDHLAVLPNEEGACSVEDGCGANVTNSKGGDTGAKSVNVEVDASPIKSMIDDLKNLIKNTFKGGSQMDKEKLISQIASNENSEFTKEQLEDMSLNQLQVICAGLDCNGNDGEGDGDEGEAQNQSQTEGDDEGEEAPVAENSEELTELAEALKEMGGTDKLLEAVNEVQANKDKEKEELIERIVANEDCPFDKENLKPMCNENLKKMDRMLNGADYSGKGVPSLGVNSGDDEDTVSQTPGILLNRNKDGDE